jgi:hypothetical protein
MRCETRADPGENSRRLTAQYSVSDPVIALTRIEKFQDAFCIVMQTAKRGLVFSPLFAV